MTNQPNTHDAERPSRGAPAPRADAMACPGGDGHDDHLALNGECPWCGAYTDELARELGIDPYDPTEAGS
jgi:hypothetical protein